MLTRRHLFRNAALGAGALTFATDESASAAAVETSQTDDGGFGFGESLRPWQKSWIGVSLPPNAAIDSAAVGTELLAQSKLARPTVNIYADAGWTLEPIIASKNTPLVPVTMTNAGDYHTAAILKLGVPIPAGTVPPTAGEPTLAIWQPDYTNKYGAQGRYFELYKMRVDANGNWFCETGCRYWNINGDKNARSYTWTGGPGGSAYATDPDSTYTSAPFTTGAGLPYMPLVLSLADVKRGYCDHALGLELVRSYGHVWPATRSDGASPGNILREGDRYTFPQGYVMPSGLHPLAYIIGQAQAKYGLVAYDMSGCLAVRLAPSIAAAGYLNGAADYAVLDGYPWQDSIRLDATNMSNTNQTPATS